MKKSSKLLEIIIYVLGGLLIAFAILAILILVMLLLKKDSIDNKLGEAEVITQTQENPYKSNRDNIDLDLSKYSYINGTENNVDDEILTNLPVMEREYIVMLDPGHGGKDPGTSSGKLDEKDVTLSVGLMVREYLANSNITVLMTRDKDEYMDKSDRATFANDKDADVFVSLHCNYIEKDNVTSGVETYYLETAPNSEGLAQIVHKKVLGVTKADDRHIRTNDFVVIRKTNMPAILVEMGYLSNWEDVKKLAKEEYKNKMAYAIAAGIIEYLNQ